MARRPPKPVLIALVITQVVSARFAYRDLARRGDDAIRGRRLLWRIAIALNPGNSMAYWLVGRRKV